MKKYILDASVAVKWLFPEPLADQACLFLRKLEQKQIEIIVPELFYCEIANTCKKRVQYKFCELEFAIVGMDKVLGLSLESRLNSEFADVALENALHYKVSTYDAFYLALAETYAAPLVTADENLVRTCRSKGFNFIESLSEVKLS